MTEMSAADVVSAIVLVVLLIVLLALLGPIIYRSRKTGQPAPVHSRDWFVDTFRQGLEIIRRCPWILIIPLIAKIIRFIEVLPSTHAAIQKLERSSPTSHTIWSLEQILLLLRDLPRNFIRALGLLNTAMFYAFLSGIVMLIILVGIAFLFLRSEAPSKRISDTEPNPKTRRVLGVVLGLASLCCIYPGILMWTDRLSLVENTSFSVFYGVTVTFLSVIVVAFAGGTLLLLMVAASDKQVLSVREAFMRAEMHFRPLFLFGLIMAGLVHLSVLPTTLIMLFNGFSYGGGPYLGLMTDRVTNIIFAILAFIPVIIVKECVPVSSAFARSVALWARNAKNAAVFVCISAFLLMIPMFLTGNLRLFFSYAGWPLHIARFIGSSIIAAVGVLVMSSIVVFYKKVQQIQEELS